MDSTPHISIIVPCYNHGMYLEETVASVIAQTYQKWECIIVDDGSTEDLAAVKERITVLDARIHFYHKENGGLADARNFGIEKAQGSYILPLDADDKISPSYLEKAIAILEKEPEVKVVYGQAEFFGNKNGVWQLPKYSSKQLALKNPIYCSAVFRKEDWKRAGGYDLQMKYGLEDWEFWIHILKDGGDVKHIPETCFYYRITQDSMVRSIAKEQKKALWEYLSKKHTNFLVTQLGSIHYINDRLSKKNAHLIERQKGKRYATNLFFKRVFGFQIFKKSRIDE